LIGFTYDSFGYRMECPKPLVSRKPKTLTTLNVYVRSVVLVPCRMEDSLVARLLNATEMYHVQVLVYHERLRPRIVRFIKENTVVSVASVHI
jgi:hypothetical protein